MFNTQTLTQQQLQRMLQRKQKQKQYNKKHKTTKFKKQQRSISLLALNAKQQQFN
jgi:hypothetical protein